MEINEMAIRNVRFRGVLDRTGLKHSKQYDRISDGLFTPGILDGQRIRIWPEYEVDALISAGIAGWTDEQIRRLVAELKQLRPEIAGLTELEICSHVKRIMAGIRAPRTQAADSTVPEQACA